MRESWIFIVSPAHVKAFRVWHHDLSKLPSWLFSQRNELIAEGTENVVTFGP